MSHQHTGPRLERHRLAPRALPLLAMATGSGWVSAALLAAAAPAAVVLHRNAMTHRDRAVSSVVPPASLAAAALLVRHLMRPGPGVRRSAPEAPIGVPSA